MRLRATLMASLMIGAGHLGVGWAAEPAGTAAAVNPSVNASGNTGARRLVVDGSVFMGDIIKTSNRGTAQIRFRDDTRLAVGPNSSVTIDEFVFSGSNTASRVTINLTQGAFRFLTGVSAKSAYAIDTPTATIGVRGTEGGIVVDGPNIYLANFGGTFRICNKLRPRSCALSSQHCDVIMVSADGKIGWEKNVYNKTKLLEDKFYFKERRLQPDFRVDSRSCNVPDIAPNNQGQGSPSVPPPVLLEIE